MMVCTSHLSFLFCNNTFFNKLIIFEKSTRNQVILIGRLLNCIFLLISTITHFFICGFQTLNFIYFLQTLNFIYFFVSYLKFLRKHRYLILHALDVLHKRFNIWNFTLLKKFLQFYNFLT